MLFLIGLALLIGGNALLKSPRIGGWLEMDSIKEYRDQQLRRIVR